MSTKKVTSVGKQEFKDFDGYPGYSLEIDGEIANFVLGTHKLTLLDQGFISLGGKFSEYTVEVPSKPGQTGGTLEGFTDDPRVVQLYRDFLASRREG